MGKLSHMDSQGNAKMVDVGDKPLSQRFAVARGGVRVAPNTNITPFGFKTKKKL